MFKDLLKDPKVLAMLITSSGGVLLAGYAFYGYIQGFNTIQRQMENTNSVIMANSAAISANTQATNQMNQLLIQVLGNKMNKASLIKDISNVAVDNTIK